MSEEKQTLYGVHVVFNENGKFSQPYTYKSKKAYAIGTLVVARTQFYFSAGRVIGCDENFEFDPNIRYRGIYANLGIPKK